MNIQTISSSIQEYQKGPRSICFFTHSPVSEADKKTLRTATALFHLQTSTGLRCSYTTGTVWLPFEILGENGKLDTRQLAKVVAAVIAVAFPVLYLTASISHTLVLLGLVACFARLLDCGQHSLLGKNYSYVKVTFKNDSRSLPGNIANN